MKTLVLFLVSVALAISLSAQESITLDAPVQVDPGAARFQIVLLHLDWLTNRIVVGLQEADQTGVLPKGKNLTFEYRGAEARTIMVALNKSDLSVKSLQRRVIEKLQADGKLGTGTLSGSPE